MTWLRSAAPCLALLTLVGLALGQETSDRGGSSPFEPPVLRDVDDRLFDLLELKEGEEREFGDFLSASGRKEEVLVARRTPEKDEPLEIECRRATDRCFVVTHGDGTAELRRARTLACTDQDETSGGASESDASNGTPGLVVRRIVHRDGCFEDLRVVAGRDQHAD